MIRRGNLNLVVVQKEAYSNDACLQQEVNQLELMLRNVLLPASVAIFTEVADLNKYQHHTQHQKVLRFLVRPEQIKPFVFLLNMN